jgi:HlyD family secretion protein
LIYLKSGIYFPLTARVLGPAVVCIVVSMVTWAPGISDDGLLIVSAQAQSKSQDPLERARTAVETLINRLRGRDMQRGSLKPTAASPETEAQLRVAQAQVIKAKQALAEAVALIAQRKSDLDFAKTDFERGMFLLEHANIPKQTVDQRRNRFEAAEAGLVAANAQRDQAEAAIKAAEADVERLQSILVDLVLVSPRSGRVQYRLARAGVGRRGAGCSDNPRSQ